MSEPERLRDRVAGRAYGLAMSRSSRYWRRRLLVEAALQCRLRGSEASVQIHPSCRFEGPAVLDIAPGTTSRVTIDRHVVVGERVRFNLRGGDVSIGAETQVRRFVTVNAGGRLSVGSRVVLSQSLYVHCSEDIEVGDDSILGENVTLADSNHVRTAADVPIHHSVRSAPVRIGCNVWVGASALITAGVSVGDQCVIGGGAVVTQDVPAWWLAGGNPARAIRELHAGESFGPPRELPR